jgi:hydroxymethylpyrimidine pyrophosphatase-like HAD family hydrolase
MSPYTLLAVDYDGTLAHEGIVEERTVEALRRLQAASVRLVLVTGRRLASLQATFAHAKLFEAIVIENGAAIYHPATGRIDPLTVPAPADLTDRLRAAGVPIVVGHSIIESVEPYHHAILAAIRESGLEWHIVFNRDAVMALPSVVNKATGLAHLLKHLKVDPAEAVGIGDAENDPAFLAYCGRSVAVANAVPAVKASVQLVTNGASGEGVIEVVDRWLAGELTRPRASVST